jgi:hypothetical protein
MDEQQPISPRARLQALLAIPERQRTDAEWDELNELEIMLATGNREGGPQQNARLGSTAPAGHPKQGGKPHQRRKQSRKFHHKPPRRNMP